MPRRPKRYTDSYGRDIRYEIPYIAITARKGGHLGMSKFVNRRKGFKVFSDVKKFLNIRRGRK
jgi:hypothetical protein